MTKSRSRSRSKSRNRSGRLQRLQVAGERNSRAALTAHDVDLMRELHEEHSLGYKRLARKFDVGVTTARDVCTYRTWLAGELR